MKVTFYRKRHCDRQDDRVHEERRQTGHQQRMEVGSGVVILKSLPCFGHEVVTC